MKRRLTLVLAMLLCASLLFGCSVSRNSADADTVENQKQDQREESTDNIDTEEKSDSEQDEQENAQEPGSEDVKKSEPETEPEPESDNDNKVISGQENGTKDSPVPKASAYTWSGMLDSFYKYEYVYSLTVNDAKLITPDELKAMKLRVNEDDQFDYWLLDLILTAEIKLLDGEEDSAYITSFFPNIVGAETPEGEIVIGSAYFGFEDAIKDNLSDQVGFNKINAGETASYSVDGKVIIPVYKEKTNYLVIRDDESNNKIYFSLE